MIAEEQLPMLVELRAFDVTFITFHRAEGKPVCKVLRRGDTFLLAKKTAVGWLAIHNDGTLWRLATDETQNAVLHTWFTVLSVPKGG